MQLTTRPYGTVFDLDGATTTIADIELQMQDSSFWDDHERAGQLSKQLDSAKQKVSFWRGFETQLQEYQALTDEELETFADDVKAFAKDFDTQYIRIFLSGPYDDHNALMHIYAGAGGQDSQDWARMLKAMYSKWCEDHGYGFRVLHEHVNEQGGIKNATIEITGHLAYGYLRGEAGVHRLVRQSPFNAKALRHTSFALVEILPELKQTTVTIDEQDLKIDTFKSSGPGGQNVNKLETAVRITHVPTNTVVAVQSERSQAQNKEKAMMLLQSKLVKLMQEHQVQEVAALRGKLKDQQIEWGNQIRSYVLHPYKMVKDHRTNVEVSNAHDVLDGQLDPFIESDIIKLDNSK